MFLLGSQPKSGGFLFLFFWFAKSHPTNLAIGEIGYG
jgi:hypothetical protein